jgi:uncharacterized protein YebE (UPF0316 family)
MDAMFFDSNLFLYGILPLLIFLSRIIDVTIGTIRVIFISKGLKYYAPIMGFFEVIIWLLVIKQVLTNVNNPINYIAYGLGFAAGTFVGIIIEEKMSIGKVIVRIITKKDASELLETLKLSKYNVTGIEAEGNTGKVKLIFTVIDRKQLCDLVKIVKHFNPNAFYTIEEIKYCTEKEIQKTNKINFFNILARKK